MDDLCLKCKICLDNFSDSHAPRMLECGHVVCSPCVNHTIVDTTDNKDTTNSCKCSTDLEGERRKSLSDLTTNYPLIKLARLCNFAALGPETIQRAGRCPKHGFCMFFMCLSCKVWVCRDCIAAANPNPSRGKCQILSVHEALDKIKTSHQKILKSYRIDAEKNYTKLQNIITRCNALIKYCEKDNSKISNGNYQQNLQDIIKEREEVKSQLNVLENVSQPLKHCLEMINEACSRECIIAASETSMGPETAYEKFMLQENGRKIHLILNTFIPGKEDLVELLEAGKAVYGIREEGDTCRWAKVVSSDKKILLYALRDSKPPKDGIQLPFELLRALVPQESPIVFMDFRWGGEFKGRVCFQMFGDTPRGRQAVLLCSGEQGPSYRNTLLYDTYIYENEDACIKGGDYEKNDGTGGCAIVNDIINDDIYKHKIKVGLLAGWPVEQHYRLGSFKLYTWDYDDIYNNFSFGIAIDNPEFIVEKLGSESLRLDDHPQVMDCGLIIIS